MTKRSLLLGLGPVLLPALAAGCSSGSDYQEEYQAYQKCIADETAGMQPASTTPTGGTYGANLVASDPASVVELLRANIRTNAKATLDNQRISLLANKRCEPLKPKPRDEGGLFGMPASAKEESADDSSGGSSSGGAKQASGTNNQVAGVDEADFVKNDNKYIYVANGSHFRVIDAFPGANMHEIGSVEIKGTAKKLFVEGNRAVVYSSVPKATGASSGSYSWWKGYSYGGSNGECTYGQSGCVPSGDGTETEIAVYDLTDRAQPKLLRSIHSTSSFVAARRIGNAVHTVLVQPTHFDIPYPQANASQEQSEAQINAEFARAAATLDEQISAKVIDTSVLPAWTDSKSQGVNVGVYKSESPDGDSLTSVLTLDLASETNLNVTSIVSSPGWIYASGASLYMAVPHSRAAGRGGGWYDSVENEITTIHKFALAQASTSYFGSGIVTGRVLNQLAMDDQNGFLRVATTAGYLPSPDAKNLMTVLEPQGQQLVTVGKIDNIAPGEDIRSARFDGDRGYIVTFKKTDPLYVFDLVDPRAPKILGELKIPGFSTYMHMMDENHLLTIGYDAADQGSFAFFTGIMLQIFDVTNPQDPKLTHKEVIGTRGSSSEAATNHLAFNYFGAKNLLAIPMTICEGGDTSGGYGTEMTFSGLMVYDVTAQGGFKLRGKVAHPSVGNDSANDYGYYNSACTNWWTNASSEVKRSIIMDDWVYSVSDSRIKANALGNLSQDVKEVPLGTSQQEPYESDY